MTRTYVEALALARDGWLEGAEMIEQMVVELTDKIIRTVEVPEIRYDVTGDELDIGRFVVDEPEDFMTLVPIEIDQEPRVLHLVVTVCASAATSTSKMLKKGLAAVALIDALEKCGKRVIVDITDATSADIRGDLHQIIVRVKEAHESVNLSSLAFLLGHPSTPRRLMFSASEHLPAAQRREYHITDGRYGRAADVKVEERGDIYIGYTQNFDTDEEITEWVLQQLEAQGVNTQKVEVA